MVKFVALTEAKAQLSELIDRTLEGEEVIITRHGKPVVKLVPYEKPKLVYGLLEGKLSKDWAEINFDDSSHMDESWAAWRQKIERLGN
ncbi:type II toxin-antitoxin system Phd/YefM family antitoxin [Aquiluna borgnonia]|uniref:Antitoxin n=1 Tax=Aquiluna borgnonia TaxID=2499157 RepID=A0A7D4QF77_9MICO|nr:type II toxin-antitoxin system prevent-host-death family antitoxin [Aquiluna borgnonia]QKJ24708.1 type II toxin-antitoxin system Phd/YefM family antitoxin [Aquiluna borgnonia]